MLGEVGQELGQHERAQGDEAGDPDPPAHLLAPSPGGIEHLVHVRQHRPGVAEDRLTRRGQHQAPCALPDEELRADLPLELATAADSADWATRTSIAALVMLRCVAAATK